MPDAPDHLPRGVALAIAPSDPGMSLPGFVALMAGLMAINALGIDSMLAALPQIGQALGVTDENERQLVMVVYVLGFGAAQLFWGPLADALGRRRIVVACTLTYGAFSIVAGLVPSFTLLLVARLLQGVAAAASRVLVVSIVRDCFSGRTMARVMSLSFMVFLCVPILAPSLGQLILLATGSWRCIFFCLGGFAVLLGAISLWRLRETLHPEYRRPVSFGGVGSAMARVLTDRIAIGYTLAGSATFGAMLGFINSVQQIFAEIFHEPRLFTLVFAGMAGAMGFAGYLNARIVERLGSRMVSHAALLAMLAATGLHLTIALAGYESVVSFTVLQGITMFCQGLLGSNFNSMAMEPVGDIAGTAASVQGFVSTTLAAGIGYLIGHAFNGSTVPITAGFFLMAIASMGLVLFAEHGRLFRSHNHRVPA